MNNLDTLIGFAVIVVPGVGAFLLTRWMINRIIVWREEVRKREEAKREIERLRLKALQKKLEAEKRQEILKETGKKVGEVAEVGMKLYEAFDRDQKGIENVRRIIGR